MVISCGVTNFNLSCKSAAYRSAVLHMYSKNLFYYLGQGDYVIIGVSQSVSQFVCLLAELCKNYSIDFHNIRWNRGTYWPRKKPLDLGGNPHHASLGLL